MHNIIFGDPVPANFATLTAHALLNRPQKGIKNDQKSSIKDGLYELNAPSYKSLPNRTGIG